MPEMLRELEPIETLVMNELQKKGYPRESIVFNWKLDARRYVDFVVVDTDTGMPLMMIEVKAFSERTQNAIKTMAFDNLKKYYDKEKTPIKMIAAFFNREIGEFVFVDFTEAIKENNFNKLIENYEIPTYELLTTGVRQKVISHAKEKQNKNINTLKILCWVVIPLIGIILVVLDALNIYTFSSLRLIVIGTCIGGALLPCFKEIKIGEISIKNAIENKKENRDD